MVLPCPFSPLSPAVMGGDDGFMCLAYNESLLAWKEDEVPVGAVLVLDGKVLICEHNRVRQNGDPSAHGEMLALRSAAKLLGDWRLCGCTLYTTKEPCPMCSGACAMARVARVVFGVADPLMGCLGGCGHDLSQVATFYHRFTAKGGVLANEIRPVLRTFFQQRRNGSIKGVAKNQTFPLTNFHPRPN
ncbi:MAG: nucleoside deaminase [Puniceicoccales bacterium]|nr:nucleoside deaminase [Puniceicoccales bacterium]